MDESLHLPTERESVSLQQLTVEDVPYFFNAVMESRLRNSGHLNTFVLTDSYFPTVQATEEAIRLWHQSNTTLVMGIWDRNEFVGCIDVGRRGEETPELGYWLDERQTGKGYATIATRAIARFAKDKYGLVAAQSDVKNTRSMAVLARVGFKRIKQSEGMAYFLY